MTTRMRSLFVVLLLVAALDAGCGRAPKDAAVALRGWSLTTEQVARECEQIRGPGVFDTMSTADREVLARTLADREILLRLARQEKVQIQGRQERGFRVDYEQTLIREFLRDLRLRSRPDPEQEERELQRLLRRAQTQQFTVIDSARASKAEAALRAGRDFAAAAAEFSDVVPPPGREPRPLVEKVVRVDDRTCPPQVIREALLRDLPAGGLGDPVRTPDGTTFLRVTSYEPLEEASDSVWVRRARRALINLNWMERFAQWSDSLKQASGRATHPETYPMIAERVMALRDSIQSLRSEGIDYDLLAIRAPVWRFTAEELARPVYALWGKTHTVADYLASLNTIGLDFWPGSVPLERSAEQIEARIDRILVAEEANRRGFPSSPTFQQALRPVEEKWLLESYFAAVTASVPEPSADTLRAAYERYRERFRYPETISFSALGYPPSQEARAREAHRELRAGPPELMSQIGSREMIQWGAWYLPRTQRYSVDLGSPRPELEEYWNVALKLKDGEYSDLFQTSKGLWAIVRVEEHSPARDRTMDEIRDFLVETTKGAEQNRIMEELLRNQRRKLGLKVWPERLQEWQPTAPESD